MIRNRIIFVFAFFFIIFLCSCNKETKLEEEQSETFLKLYGGNGFDLAKDIILADSGYAITGSIQTADSAMQAFLMVTDNYGNQVSWSPVLFGGILNDCGNKIFKNTSGDYFIVGTTVKSVTETDSSDIMVACISSNGILKWKKTFGGSATEEGLFGICTSDNNLIFGGYTKSYGNGGKDICLYKISSSGELSWTNYLGGSLNDVGKDIIQVENNLYLIGTSNSYSSDGSDELMVVKVSESNGKPISANYFSLNGYNLDGIKINTLASSDNILLVANSKRSGGTSYGSYLVNISDDLSKKWATLLSASGTESPASFIYSSNEIYTIVNKFSGNNTNPFLYKLDINGNIVNTSELSNTGNQKIFSATINNSGFISIVGQNTLSNSSQILFATGLFN